MVMEALAIRDVVRWRGVITWLKSNQMAKEVVKLMKEHGMGRS
jgi:hypothetical protein